jgi:hypothetical protein
MPSEISTKDVVLAKHPEAYAWNIEDAEYVILSDKTEDAISLGFREKTEDEAWESALVYIEDREAEDADFGEYDEDEEEDEED